jgi:membrane-bound ClpP family serine protease
MSYATWGFICLTLALLLFFLEIFIPSGGVLSVAAAVSAIVGVVLFYLESSTWGLVSAIITIISIPFLVGMAMKIMPDTPIARLLILKSNEEKQDTGQQQTDEEKATKMIGAQGKALTDLRPVGKCLINGQRHQCLAMGGLIRQGALVRVISSDGMQIKVRAES